MDSNKIFSKLEEYKALLDFNNKDRKKDFKGNLKFIKWAVNKMIKNKETEQNIMKFIQDTIDIHNKVEKQLISQP